MEADRATSMVVGQLKNPQRELTAVVSQHTRGDNDVDIPRADVAISATIERHGEGISRLICNIPNLRSS